MNQITIIGNLTSDPAERQTRSGKNLAAFDVAVTMSGQDAQPLYIGCTSWDDPVKGNILKYLHKGSKVAVYGTLDYPNAYLNKQGEPKASYKVRVEKVEFLPNGNRQAQGNDAHLPENIPGQYGNYQQGYQRSNARNAQSNIQPIPPGFSEVNPTDDDNGFFNPFGGNTPY